MRNIIPLLGLCLIFGCHPAQDENFQLFYKNFQENMEEEPLLRAFLEERLQFDSVLVIAHEREIQKVLAWSQHQLETLHQFDPLRLKEGLQEHYDNLHSFLGIIIGNIETRKIHARHPGFYAVFPYLKRTAQSNDLTIIGKNLDQVSHHFSVAIQNLKSPDAAQLEPVVSESIAVFEFLKNEVAAQIEKLSGDQEETKVVLEKLEAAKLEVKNFIGFCNSWIFEGGD